MGLLDPLFDALAYAIEAGLRPYFGPGIDIEGEELEDAVSDAADQADELVEGFFGGIFEALEEDVTNEITEGGNIQPNNVEGRITDAEGAAIEDALVGIAAGLGIEFAGAAELETHQFALTQIMSFMALEDVLGRELGMYYQKGVDPALEAKVARETRSEFVNLADFVEDDLRRKNADAGWLSDPDIYGIRPDQVEKIERVAIETMEPEELFETPVQFGITIPPELVEAELDRSGVSEDVKDLFRDVAAQIPRSNQVWSERTAIEPVVSELDALVVDGEITPERARNLLPGEAEDAADALHDRWTRISDLPNKAPSGSDAESWFQWGLIGRGTFIDILDRTDVSPEKYPSVVGTAILDEIDGDLRTALGVGIIDENRFSQYCKTVGLSQDVIRELLAGADLDDIGKAKAAEEIPLAERPTTVVIDIGTSRGAALEGAGIETVGDLARADVETVSTAAALTPESAELLIKRAKQMVN